MADRVQPGDMQPSDGSVPPPPNQPSKMKPPAPTSGKPAPAPGTYIIQVPKDQIHRLPQPENASRYQHLSSRKPRCSRCCCCFFVLILFLIIAAGIAVAVIYFVFRPESPHYSVERVSIKGFNLLSLSSPLSPEFDVAVRASNPNDKIGIYYDGGSTVGIDYQDVTISKGFLPEFYQPANNVTFLAAVLKGSGTELTNAAKQALLEGESKGTVPFKLRMRSPVRMKVGDVTTWEITVKVTCGITVDKLTAGSKIVSKVCDYGVDLW